MAVKIENMPSPSVLMNSMRSIGYTFKTALADIVDNSISACAKNVYIEIPINDDDLNVTILDDGKGMSRDDLFNAMKYGITTITTNYNVAVKYISACRRATER